MSEYVSVPRRLTAENGAKAALSGEFTVEYTATCPDCSEIDADDECVICRGEVDYTESVTIPWSTIKDIYAAAIHHFARNGDKP
ncbi:hypothetical protein JQR88_11100 [Pseudomonas luteola]|uniref:hypothetical protein n=1 Tax=Pseudomonas luteola TaxID=47886 RepID=UPI003DA069B0